MAYNSNDIITGPARGNTVALAVTTSQATFDLAEVLPGSYKDGNYITLSCNQIFYLQFSAAAADVINITDSLVEDSAPVAADDQHAAGPFAANTPYRMRVPVVALSGVNVLAQYMHVIAAAGGILRIWKSSSNLV